jgi:DNA replication protein DnaC
MNLYNDGFNMPFNNSTTEVLFENFRKLPTTVECNIHGLTRCLTNGKCMQCNEDKLVAQAKLLTTESTRDKLMQSGFGVKFKNVTFENYQPNSPSQQSALDICKRYAFSDKVKSGGKGVVLLGTPGVGKTHLSACIAKEFINRNDRVQYIKYYQLNGARYPDITMKSLSNVRLLIIDEVGTQNTDFKQESLFEIIDMRYDRGLNTVLITNLTEKEFDTMMSDALISRLAETSYRIQVTGNDYRLTK